MKHKHLLLSAILTLGLGQPVLAADTAKPAAAPTHDELLRGFKAKIKLDGDAKKFEKFTGLLDTFDAWYQVVMPIGTK
jgi:alkyl sulfatase BDS1-like metallo-beta-lactamase superfamily hydrolase